jgi:hypothetical protein
MWLKIRLRTYSKYKIKYLRIEGIRSRNNTVHIPTFLEQIYLNLRGVRKGNGR